MVHLGVAAARSRPAAVVLATVLVWTGAPAAPGSAGAIDPTGVRPVVSATAPDGQVEPPAPVAETAETTAMRQATATGEPVVVDALTTAHQLVTADPESGTMVAEISALPARVHDGTGWVPVDPSLRRTDDGSIRPIATSVELAFSGGGEGEPLARMAKDDHWLALTWPGGLPEPLLDGAVATYPDAVAPGIDLVVQAGVVGFSHYLVVRDARAADDPALERVTLGLRHSGLTADAAPGGATNLRDRDGEVAFVVPPARMWDSAGAAGDAAGLSRAVEAGALIEPDRARSAAMPVEVTGSEVTVVPDRELLRDPDTVFPVVIDPSYSDGHIYWRMVWSNGMSFPNSSTEQARVGYDGWSGQNKRSRVFYRFDISTMRNREIVSARFEHRQVHSPNHDCSLSVFGPAVQFHRSDAIDSSTSWPGPTGYSSSESTSRTVNGHSGTCGGWTRTTFNAKSALAHHASRGDSRLTIRLRSSNESDRNGWRRFANTNGYPKLIATYNSPPSTPTNLHTTSPSTSCATSSNRPWINDNSPNLRATLSGPSGQNLRGRFQRQRDTGSGFGSSSTSTTSYGSSGSVRSVSLSGLGEGRWRWRVRAEDTETQSSYSSWCYFQLDTTPPPAPSLSISDPYSFSFWVAPDGRPQATLTVDRGSDTGVDRFRYAIGSATPTTTNTMSSSTGTVTFTPPYGVTTVSARLLDRAGNLGPIATATLRVMSPRAQHGWMMNDQGGSFTADLPRPVDRGLPLHFGSEVTWDDGNGTETGADPQDRALRFDGTGPGAHADGPGVFEMDSFTVTAWAKVDTAEAGHGTFIAASQDGVSNSTFRLGYALATESWAVWRNGTEGGGTFRVEGPKPVDQVDANGLPFPDGEPDWQHLAAVYDAPAGVVRLYVDGNFIDEESYTFPAAPGGAFRVGRGNNGGGAYGGARSGRVDDVVTFDAALTEAQIRVLRGVDTAEQLDTERDGMLDHGLAAGWSFAEGAGDIVADSSGNGHELSLAAGVSWVDGPRAAADPADRALRFDGTAQGYAQTTGPVIDTSSSFSVSAWVRLTGTSTLTGGIAAQGGQTAAGTPQNGMLMVYSESFDAWRFGKRRIDNGDYNTVRSFDPPARDTWVHLTGVFELYDLAACEPTTRVEACGISRLYVDGVLQESRASTQPWNATDAFQLGRYLTASGEFNYPFRGDIDEVRVYERALSPAEAGQLFAAGTGAPAEGDTMLVVGGTLVADADITSQSAHATGFTGNAGRPWQLSATSAEIVWQ